MAKNKELSSDGKPAAARDIRNGLYGWYEKGAMEKIETLPFGKQASCKLIYIGICSMSAKRQNASLIECYKFDIARFASVSEKTVQRYLPELENLGIIGISPQDRLSNGKFEKVKIWLKQNNLTVGHFGDSSETDERQHGDTESDTINKEINNPIGLSAERGPAEEKNFGNKEVSAMLLSVKRAVGVTDFKESHDQQRQWARNFVFLFKGTRDRAPIPAEEIRRRLVAICRDEFKAKNRNSIQYLYKEVKAFVGNKPPPPPKPPPLPDTPKDNSPEAAEKRKAVVEAIRATAERLAAPH